MPIGVVRQTYTRNLVSVAFNMCDAHALNTKPATQVLINSTLL